MGQVAMWLERPAHAPCGLPSIPGRVGIFILSEVKKESLAVQHAPTALAKRA